MLGIIGKNVKTEESTQTDFHSNFFSLQEANSFYENDHFLISISGTITNSFDSLDLTSNEEIILNLYNTYGVLFYKRLQGTFFIILWDKEKERLVLANNAHQTSNLYYAYIDQVLYFSDSLKKISNKLRSSEPFFPSIRSFISNGFTYSDKTQLAEISKLLPTFSIVYEEMKLSIHNHWDEEIYFKEEKVTNLEKRLDQYEETYQKVLKDYLNKHNEEEVGCLLSGGHDTSFAAIQLRNITKNPIKAYTITFPNWAFNEELHAKRIANKLDLDFTPIPFKPEHIDSIVELIHAVEEPVVGVALPLFILSKHAQSEVDIIIGGDGGDTIWGEYYPVAEFHRYVKHLPLFLRVLIHKTSKLLAKVTDWERFWELEHVAELFAHRDYYDQFMRKLCTYRHFNDSTMQQLFKEEFYQNGIIARSILEVPFNKRNFSQSLIEGKLFNAFYTYMGFSQTKLMKYCDIKFFMPTVQKAVIDFITSLPMKWINGGTTIQRLTNNKKINRKFHKRALSRYLNKDEIYNRSFDIPWHLILSPREDILSELEKSLIKRGWYKESYINNLFSEFKNQKVNDKEILQLKNHGYRIFTLLSLEVWCLLFLDNKEYKEFNGSVVDFLRGKN